jgi:hypothetical protein
LPLLTHPSLQYHNHPQSPARLSLSHHYCHRHPQHVMPSTRDRVPAYTPYMAYTATTTTHALTTAPSSRPFAMPCNPPRPLLVETVFCPLPRSLLHIPRPTEPIAPHRDRQVPSPHNDPSPTANLRTHLLSLSQHTRTHACTHTTLPTYPTPKPPRNLPSPCDAIPPSCSLQRLPTHLPTDLNNLSDPAFATRRPTYPYIAHTTSTRKQQLPILPTS